MEVIVPKQIDKAANSLFTRTSEACYLDYTGWYAIADAGVPRYNYRFLDDNTSVGFEGLLIEPTRTNLWTNNATMDGLSVSYSAASTKTIALPSTSLAFVFSFYGTGSVTVTYTYPPVGLISETLYGTGSNQRVWKAYPTGLLDVTFTVSGTVNRTQVEPLDYTINVPLDGLPSGEAIAKYARPTSWIPNLGSTPTTRAEENIKESGIVLNDFVETTATYETFLTYNIGSRVLYNYNIYESTIDSNLGNVPTGLDDDLNWNFVKTSNEFAMLDLKTDASSTIAGRGHFVIVAKGEFIDSASLLQLNAYDVDVCISHYSKVGFLANYKHQEGTDADILTTSILGGSLYADGNYGTIISFRISSQIDRASELPINPLEEISVGELLYGNRETIGSTLFGVSSNITDYSVKTTNVFGTTTYVKRGFSKRVSGDIHIKRAEQNTILRLLYSLRAEPALWIFSDNEEDAVATVVFGAYNTFGLKISYPTHSIYNIEIEGLVL